MRLHLKKRILDDDASLHDQNLVNDTEVWVTIKKNEMGRVEFEEIDKVAGQVFEYEYPMQAKEPPKETDIGGD